MAKTTPKPTDAAPAGRPPNKLVFSLGSILVVTFVVAVMGLLLGRMFMALGSKSPVAVGYFAILAAVAPSLALVGAGTAFSILQWLQKMK